MRRLAVGGSGTGVMNDAVDCRKGVRGLGIEDDREREGSCRVGEPTGAARDRASDVALEKEVTGVVDDRMEVAEQRGVQLVAVRGREICVPLMEKSNSPERCGETNVK